MSLQNLAASANFQLFSKALQENAQQAGDNASTDAQQALQQNPAISAADLQQFMLSQLDQQLYLSQLARFGTGTESTTTSSVPFPQQQQAVSSNGSEAMNQQQHHSSSKLAGKSEFVDQNNIGIGAEQSIENNAMAQQFLPQNLMEQFLEAATAGINPNQLDVPNCQQQQQQPSADELNQLMAQLVNGCAAGGGGANAMDLQAQLLAAAAAASGGAQQQQQYQQPRADTQSPLQQTQQQQQLGLIDQLQLLQMLAGSGAAANGNVPGLAELLAAGISLPTTQNINGSNEQQQQIAQFGGSKSGHDGGGSPNNKDAYCEICNKSLCNRYFLRTHMAKKHGIGVDENNKSPLKLYNGPMERIFFNQNSNAAAMQNENHMVDEQQQLQQQRISALPGRSLSMSHGSTAAAAHHHQQSSQRDSPTTGMNYHPKQLTQKQSICSTPGLGLKADPSLNESISAEQQQQLMSQCIVQQLASQLGLNANASAVEQFLGATSGLPLADLFQQQQNGGGKTSPAAAALAHSPRLSGEQQQQQQHPTGSTTATIASVQQIACAHCTKQFPTQSTLFQHQLADHIGGNVAKESTNLMSNNNNNNGTNEQNNAVAMRWAALNAGGTDTTTSGGGTISAGNGQQQQQLLGQLMGSPALGGAHQSILPATFGGINPMELDGAAMLAKLSAELQAVNQAHGQGLLQTGGGIGSLMNAAAAAAAGHQNKPPPQKRQYSSTSKNFCDLCNKEVCNKYFLRTHMFKMHNIVIDENKATIANIDTVEKERKGEVKFRCNLCKTNMVTREQLRAHKREVHGMQPTGAAGNDLMTSPQSAKSAGIGINKMAAETAMMSNGIAGGGAMETGNDAAQQQQQQQKLLLSSLHASTTGFSASSLGIDGRKMLPDNGSEQHDDYEEEEGDEDEEEIGDDENMDEDRQTTADGALPTSVKQLLCQLIGDPLLATTRISSENARKESGEKKPQQRIEEWANQCGEREQQQNGADANNNISCRFCGLCIEGEAQLELHQLTEHSAELLAFIQSVQQQQQQQAKEQLKFVAPKTTTTEEDKLVTEVAMQMAEANRTCHHPQQREQQNVSPIQRKCSAASSSSAGASSTSASSSLHQQQPQHQPTPVIAVAPTAAAVLASPQSQPHPCAQCKRTYKSTQKLEQHKRIVHSHNFVAKMSPSKRSLMISPKKKNCLLKMFTCICCQQRFGTRLECNKHVISVHIQADGGVPTTSNNNNAIINCAGPLMKRARMDDDGEEAQQHLLAQWVREEQANDDSREELGRLLVDNQLDDADEGRQSGNEKQKEEQQQHPLAIEVLKTSVESGGMMPTEKHSHTSGSISPVSVHASSSSCGGGGGGGTFLPEGFAHPVIRDDHNSQQQQQKPFLLQSFTIRPLPIGMNANEMDGQQQHQLHGLPDELVAYLPVRCTLTQPVRVTFELQPNPLLDAQVRHI